jgi:uncharacterized protein (DUF433 family)
MFSMTRQELEERLLNLSLADKAEIIQSLAQNLSKSGKEIAKTTGVCGGEACIAGTRIAVWLLVEAQQLGIDEAQLLQDYPHITAVIVPYQAVSALERSEIAAKVKEFTVQIDGEETGTGTIIEQNGNTYTVLTCWHVLDTPGSYKIITPDGQEYQATQIKNLPDADLATIEFTSSRIYPIAELGDSGAVTPETSTYVVGYPDPIPGIPERAYTFLDAAVVSKLAKGEKGYTIIHDNPSTPGSSGGGMFDVNGSLVGVNGKFISDANTTKVYGAGIPLQVYVAARSELVAPTNITPPQDFVSVGRRKLKAKDYQGAF